MGSYQALSQSDSYSVGAASSQEILEGEGTLVGYRRQRLKLWCYYFLNVITLGFPALLCHWNPKLKVRLYCAPCSLKAAELVVLLLENEATICSVALGDGALTLDFEKSTKASSLVHQNSKTYLFSSPCLGLVPSHRYFIYKYHKFVWDEGGDCFRKLEGLEPISCRKIVEDYEGGIDESRRTMLQSIHGLNCIEVEVKSYLKLLVDEVLNPFYVFQIASVILWWVDGYIYYATCVIIISAISIAIALVETKRQAQMLRDMAQSSELGEITIRTPNGSEELICSRDLVPGDVILIPPEGFVMPCDAVLVSGSCIVNESMLTGESTPVQKSALNSQTDENYDGEGHRRHTLFCGTQVIQTRYYAGSKVSAVVVKTGFNTAKGELIHSILFPKELGFKFYADAFKFVGLMFVMALGGMGYCIYLYVSRGTAWSVTIVRVLDIVTIVVPPALPAAMTVGTVYAQSRLKSKGIFCISPPRINFCGKLKLICFDKTGTLTEDGLDLWCVVPLSESKVPEFGEALADPSSLPSSSSLLHALASCHSLTYIHGRLVGDPLDLKMFFSTGWELEEPAGGEDTAKFDLLTPTVVTSRDKALQLGILREFEFSPQLQRMSVLVRSLSSPDLFLYCKGAPEKIRGLSNPSSLPSNFDKVLDSFTVKGYRVLALGARALGPLKWHQLQRIGREAVEKELTFLGFLVMQNSLKPATSDVIEELNAASIRSVMVTGDNLLTALSVARECGIIPSCDKVIIVSVNEENELEFQLAAKHYEEEEEESTLTLATSMTGHYSSIGDGSSYQNPLLCSSRRRSSCSSSDSNPAIDFERLIPISIISGISPPEAVVELQELDYHFVMTGRSWGLLEEVASPEIFQRIVAKGTVYARMSPENKSQLVERLQELGYVVGMCGDGANDCSALKMAHVGISLSEAEASVAAPFTSNVPDISCVPNLIREGRCALVTSFAIFKYMALYSMVQFASVILLYTHKTNLADTQFLYFDLGITTSIAIVMGRTEPYPRLVPQRPMGSLVSIKNVASILLQILVCTGAQIGCLWFLEMQPWFVPLSPPTPDELLTTCWETTTIFSVTGFQYLILALVFSTGPPFRKPFYTNGMFVIVYIVLTLLTLLLASYPFTFLASFFHLMPLSDDTNNFRLWLLIFPLSNLIVSLAFEGDWCQRWIKRAGRLLIKKEEKNKYKTILRELEADGEWPPIKPPS